MLNYMDRLTLNVLGPRMMKELGLNKGHYGELESAFAYAFALGAILAGWLADRWTVRWLYPILVVAWSVAGFATGLASSFEALWVCRFLLGLCEAGHWSCALKTTQHILRAEQRSLGNGILQSGAAIGSILTPLIILFLVQGIEPDPASLAASTVGFLGAPLGQGPLVTAAALFPGRDGEPGLWRLPFLVVGAGGLGWAVLWLLLVRGRDLSVRRGTAASLLGILFFLIGLLVLDLASRLLLANATQVGWTPLVDLARQSWPPVAIKAVVCVAAVVGVFLWLKRATADERRLPRYLFLRRFVVLMVTVSSINITWHYFRAWLPLFLQEVHGYTERERSGFLTAYYIATDIGSVLAGVFTLYLVRRGLPTHKSRVCVFAFCALLCLLSLTVPSFPAGENDQLHSTGLALPRAVVSVDFAASGVPLLGLLLVIGFAALGLFPNYYSFSQELTTTNQGKVTGALGCINWVVMYLLHALVAQSLEATKSYALGLAIAGLTPLVAVGALVFLWGNAEKEN
jgi:ACS family hexuronate transporter-like MFS transporter